MGRPFHHGPAADGQAPEAQRPMAPDGLMGRISPNPSQLAVMECRERLCVVAGAGSGKTGTLVETITLRLEESFEQSRKGRADKRPRDLFSLLEDRPSRRLREGPPELDITSVLALTFTDKAAAEMRQRLALAFEKRRLKAADRGAADFWRRQSARLDRADIGTIHSFALRLLRENPLELGLTGAPALEEDSRALSLDIEDIMNDWLDQGREDLLELLKTYRPGRLKEMLAKCAGTLSSWGLSSFEADLRPRREDFAPLVRAFKDLAREALDGLLNGAVKPESSYYPKVLGAVRALTADLDAAGSEEQAADLENSLRRWKSLLDSGGDWYTKAGRALRKNLNEALWDMLARRDEEKAVKLRARFLRLTGALSRDLAAAKKRRGTISFDDILILARRLLAQNPVLRQREAARRKLVVVDEFQDTNRLQADLLAYLLLPPEEGRVFEESFPIWREMDWSRASEGFIVFGDLKQSIYRFRGAEVDIMAGLGRHFQEGRGRLMALDRNYRSQAPLVEFFNVLFPARLGPDFSRLDIQLEERPALYSGPHVLNLCSPPELRPKLSRERAEQQAALLCRYLGDLFSGHLGVMVPGEEGRPRLPRPEDVAVLFRAFTRAPVFKEALSQAGWNCRLAVGDNPFDYAEVKALLAACQYLWGIDREISLAATLRSPLGPVSDAALLRLAWPGGGARGPVPLSDYFLKNLPWPDDMSEEDLSALEDLREILGRLLPLRGRLRPVEIMERLVEERRLLPLAALEKDGGLRLRAVTGFLGLSRGAGESRRGRRLGPVEELMEMRRLWDPKRDGRRNSPSGPAVTLMTVHASKGLEFPVVILAEADRKSSPRIGPAAVSSQGRLALRFNDIDGRPVKPADYQEIEQEEKEREARENARLLYVAATRARDQLVFLGWPEEKVKKRPKSEAEEPGPDRPAPDGQAWLEAVLGCPEAAARMERLEYEPELPPDQAPRPEKADAESRAAGPPRLLEPMELKSWTLPVTSLGRFLADPEGYRRELVLGIDSDFNWSPGRPFFAAPNRPAASGRAAGRLSPPEAGTLFHAALESLDPNRPQVREVLKLEAERLSFSPEEAELEDLARRVNIFLEHPLGQSWQESLSAGRGAWRELPFTLQLGGISSCLERLTLKGVIDLFFLTKNGGQIVDYKLARAHSGPELETYEHQLRIYAQALIAKGFQAPISAALYFAGGREPVVHEVELDPVFPIEPVLKLLQKKCQSPLNNRPLRPAYPGTLNIVYFCIT